MNPLESLKNKQISNADITDLIYKAEKLLLCFPQVMPPIKEYFSNGVYAREMTIGKGTMITGRIYKDKNLNILSKGKCLIISIDGVMEVEAPFTYVASRGSKRLFYFKEDSVWTTILGTHETDYDKIVKEFNVDNYDDMEDVCQQY